MRISISLFLILALWVSGCGSDRGPRSIGATAPFTGSMGIGKVALDWTPEKVNVTCAADKCPIQVGLLIFVGQPVGKKILIGRCTAFLVAGDMVMSDGHCDHFGKARGYFVSQRIEGKREIREIVGVPFKRFTPHPTDPELASGRPDAALFQMNEPITSIPALRLASGLQLPFNKLIVFAIMGSPSENESTIRRQECTVRRHEAEFPYDISESPDMIQSFGCKLEPGTSGAPMFAPGSDEVQAVQVGGVDPTKRMRSAREKSQPEPPSHQRHWSSYATNVRCLDLPGTTPASCTVVDSASVEERFVAVRTKEMRKLQSRAISQENDKIQLRPTAYQLAPVEDMRFEVIHWPKCRRSDEKLSTVPFIIEQVEIQLDEWAVPKITSLSQTALSATVKDSSKNLRDLELIWPAPAAPYMRPDLDLRKKWGTRFAVDLPICPS